ncbi:MAG: CPBP family intramembrane metalloprotease [Ruminococcus sp.]|nr:CPBP family intramembrane metalloprotease [Ruminococcus sp.]
MEQTQIISTKKSVRKNGSRTGLVLLGYEIIFNVVAIFWMVAEVLIRAVIRSKGITDKAQRDRIFDEVLTEIIDFSGTYMIVGALVGLVFLYLVFCKSDIPKAIFRSEKKMKPACFAAIACVFFSGQLIFQGMDVLVELGLNRFGLTAQSSIESATVTSTTVSMFIYAGIIGPIAEELVFRGFTMRCLEKHGKALAVVVSSLLFGVTHGNLPQAMYAFFVGLVLGYAAIEYSIIWSIALHILNNMVFCDLMSMALDSCSEQVQNTVVYSVLVVFFLFGFAVLIRNRKKITAWIRKNMWEKPDMCRIMTTFSMLIFVIGNLLLGISMLEKL